MFPGPPISAISEPHTTNSAASRTHPETELSPLSNALTHVIEAKFFRMRSYVINGGGATPPPPTHKSVRNPLKINSAAGAAQRSLLCKQEMGSTALIGVWLLSPARWPESRNPALWKSKIGKELSIFEETIGLLVLHPCALPDQPSQAAEQAYLMAAKPLRTNSAAPELPPEQSHCGPSLERGVHCMHRLCFFSSRSYTRGHCCVKWFRCRTSSG
jgi:hypothetical protein